MSRRFIAFAAAILIAVPVAVLSGESSGQEATASGEPKAKSRKFRRPTREHPLARICMWRTVPHVMERDGKGNGPAASALKSVPTDLTQLAASNRGRFPENHVSQTIKGDFATPSHGSKDMPVWGSIFASMGTTSDGSMQLRIRNLTKYIASLQQ